MLAHHPVTGKEIRVLQTDVSLWKEAKTLAWVAAGGKRPPWDTVSSGCLADGSWPDFVIAEDGEAAAAAAEHVKVVFVKGRRIEGIRNCMSLLDMAEAYPHLGQVWDGTLADAVVLIAGLLRYRRLAGAWSGRGESLGLVQERSGACKLWWVTQYYRPASAAREREITTCLRRNAASQLIDRVVLLDEKKETLPQGLGDKVVEQVIGARLTYKAVLEWISSDAVPDDVIVAFANADICIDDASWRDLWSVNLEGKFLALLRYDVPASGAVEEATLFGPRADSQDTWIVRAADVKAGAGAGAGWSAFDFPFGKMGCDNAIALEMFRAKFLVVNPAMSLKTWHFHASGLRTYVRNDVIEKPVFLYLSPTGFHDLQPVKKWSELAAGELATADGKPALRLRSCFGTAGGLVFDRRRILMGPSKEAVAEWSAMELHALTPALECMKGLVTPWPGGAEESREVYVLRYLARILRLRSEAGWEDAEFLCPEGTGEAGSHRGAETLAAFKWTAGGSALTTMPVMKYDSDVQTWYREALVYPTVDGDALCAEDVAALRQSVRGWTSGVGAGETKRRLIIVEGGALTAKIADDLEESLETTWDVRRVYTGRSSADRMRDMIIGAWGVVCAAGLETTGWNWLLPCGSYVFELAVGTAKKPEGAVLSVCSELNHIEVRVQAGKSPVSEIMREVAGAGSGSGLPVIWMPRKELEGYFGHPGDSFREMVRLWGERGWVQVREHATATMVWWGAVGAEGVLLYDRPNHDWRLAAPSVEQVWKKGLFGNPRPSASAGAKPWSFWPRRPELVEAIVAAGIGGWDARTRGLVFYGKIENKVQERRRTAADWSGAAQAGDSEWILVRGDQPYPFTQREYLERLATAKFGLCLAGYGLKCHREVECMAMGCVPLVAPEVDMDSYAVPPREGIEYLRVANPAAAAAAAASMDRETWERMSFAGQAWWRANASCEGMFALTKKLAEE
jgi:hypothetical protein